MKWLPYKPTAALNMDRDAAIAMNSSLRRSDGKARKVRTTVNAWSAPYSPKEATGPCRRQGLAAASTAAMPASNMKCRG